jgi:hypothetical protein
MGSLFSFDKLITPSIIKFLFYIGVGFVALTALGVLLTGFTQSAYSPIPGFLYFFLAIIEFVVGVIGVRVATEMTLVIFMIRDELAWQRVNRTAQDPVASSSSV